MGVPKRIIVLYLWEELVPRFEGRLRHLRLCETRKNVFEYAGEYAIV